MTTTITQIITALPSPPTADSTDFDTAAENFLGALPDLATEVNAWAVEVNSVAANVASNATLAASAQASADSATASKNAAATSATNAASSATAAAGSASSASSSAATATTKATSATTSATNAATSESNALSYKNSASTSATNAANSATTASNAASTATTKASDASTAATNAATSATNSADSATTASNAAATATTQAGNASTSASSASTSATNAGNSATAAASSATNAANSATAAAASAAAAAETVSSGIPDATTDAKGKVELATVVETTAGTDATRAITPAGGAAAYAPIARGVTNGDGHDHSGGDGAQIAYSSLSGKPTIPTAGTGNPAALGTAAAGSAATYSASDHVHPTTGILPLSGGTMTGAINLDGQEAQAAKLKGWREGVQALGTLTANTTIDCSAGNVVTATIGGNVTFTFTNAPSSGIAYGIELWLTCGSTAYTVAYTGSVWPASSSNAAPTLTASNINIIMLKTINGGTTWRGAAITGYTS